jgi:hypothetical protein
VLVVHQPVVALLHALGSTPITPYSLRATGPWGIPVFLSLSFWEGSGRFRSLGYWIACRAAGSMGRCSRSWCVAPDLDDVVRHLSAEGPLAERRRRQCADRQRCPIV